VASLRKYPGSSKWYACFSLPDGKRVQRSTKETGRKEAQKKADQWEALAKEKAKAKQAHKVIAEIYKSAHKTDLPSADARAFFDGWLTRRKHEVKPSTFSAYQKTLTVFGASLGTHANQPLTEIARPDIERFRDSQLERIGPTTVNLYIKHLRICFEDALRDNLVAENPAKGVRPLKSEEGEGASRRPFTVDELKLILAHADTEWKTWHGSALPVGEPGSQPLGCRETHLGRHL